MSPLPKNTKKKLPVPDEHVGYLLRNLVHGLRQATETAFRQAGLELSMTHLGTLFRIYTDPGLPGAQLAKKLYITAQSMNEVLKTLEDGALVERQPHPDNQRAHRWFITDAGFDKLMSSGEYSNSVFEQMQSQLSKEEKVQFIDLLKRCIAGLNAAD
ncbi:MAG: transcriptional regulator [Verrucomicrobiaceae bacterium]|nr:transcriptional regulator [Verrucomicrobiaceae bacterium]